jgi:hypothetical protein
MPIDPTIDWPEEKLQPQPAMTKFRFRQEAVLRMLSAHVVAKGFPSPVALASLMDTADSATEKVFDV